MANFLLLATFASRSVKEAMAVPVNQRLENPSYLIIP
jgi:hypothetical protein